MEAEDSVKPSDDADVTKDDAEMECASDEEGPAETNRPDGGAASEDLGVSSSTSVAATTEHETEYAAKTCEATAEKERSGDTSKDKLETDKKDSAETSKPKDKTKSKAEGSVKTSTPTGETETAREDSATTTQPTTETEAEMKESSETSDPTPKNEMNEPVDTTHQEAEAESDTKKSVTPLPKAIAGPSRDRQVTESTPSSGTPEQSSDESRMDMPSKPPKHSGPGAAAKRPTAMALGKRRRLQKQQTMTSDDDVSSPSSSSLPPCVKLPRSALSSDSEEGMTPAERALAEARALELERTLGGADVDTTEPPSSSGSASVSVGTPDVSSDASSEQSMALNLLEEEVNGTSTSETTSEGAKAASRSAGAAQRPPAPEPPGSTASALSFAEATLRSPSSEDASKALMKWRATQDLTSDSPVSTSSLSSFTESEAGGSGGHLSRSASVHSTSTSTKICASGKVPFTRSETCAGPLTASTSFDRERVPISLTLSATEMLSRTVAATEQAFVEKMEEDAPAGPSKKAGTSSLGESPEGTGGLAGTIASGGGSPPASPSGGGAGPQPIPMDESHDGEQSGDQPLPAPPDELVTSFMGPRPTRTMTAAEWDAAKRANGKARDTSKEDDQPGPSST